MAEIPMNREPTAIWDHFDIDLFIKVADLSILNPAFAMWVPVVYMTQGFGTNTNVFFYSCVYVFSTVVLLLFRWSHIVYANRSWRFGMVGLTHFRKTDWETEVVVVTGGANGIGRIIAETLAVRHVVVVVLDVEEPDYIDNYDDVYFFKCDIGKKEEVDRVAEEIRKELGDPTILINNAGVVQGKSLLDLSENEIKKTFDVNVLAHFWTIKAFLPAMIKSDHGHIVTVSSVLGHIGVSQLSDYCASKAALLGLHDSLTAELKNSPSTKNLRNVHLSLLCPGQVRTRMFSSIRIAPGLASFFCPIVEPHNVAKEVIQVLDCCESREIYVPFYTGFAWLERGLPSWLRDAARWFTNADKAMEGFKRPPVTAEKKTE
ncbi:retinal short-chain dehydrogenase/reductase [Atractiella rhizophila]|nr:retinal short-chain dehydrogenase/reductase [Atractiella rhizophila]